MMTCGTGGTGETSACHAHLASLARHPRLLLPWQHCRKHKFTFMTVMTLDICDIYNEGTVPTCIWKQPKQHVKTTSSFSPRNCAAFLIGGHVARRKRSCFYRLSWLFPFQRNLSSLCEPSLHFLMLPMWKCFHYQFQFPME